MCAGLRDTAKYHAGAEVRYGTNFLVQWGTSSYCLSTNALLQLFLSGNLQGELGEPSHSFLGGKKEKCPQFF